MMTRLIDWLLWFWGSRRGWWALSEVMAHKDDLLDDETDTWSRSAVMAACDYQVAIIDNHWLRAELALRSLAVAYAHMVDGMEELRNRMTDEEVRFD